MTNSSTAVSGSQLVTKNDLPTGPEGFRVEESGIYSLAQDNEDEVTRIASRIDVVAKTRDENNENWGRLLKLKDSDGNEKTWSMPMEMLSGDGSEVRKNLLNLGAEIEPGMKNHARFTSYLQKCKPVQTARCVSKCGWFGNVFVLPDRTIGQSPDELVVFQSSAAITKFVNEEGTVNDWIESVGQPCINNSRLVMAICTSFSAPLLDLLGLESNGVNFRGQSSIGKTITLKVGASVFGKPVSYVKSWRATVNGIEGTALQHNGLPLMLDELAQIDSREAGDAVYTLINGKRKSRGTKDGSNRPDATWRTALMSSGEVSLAQHMSEGGKKIKSGQEIRLVDVPADAGRGFGVFEDLHSETSAKAFAETLEANAGKFYGAVGLAFIRKLTEDPITWKSEAERMIKDFEQTFPSHSSQAGRVIKQFAVKAAAGEIATKMGLTGWKEGEAVAACIACLEAWLSEYGDDTTLEDKQIIAQVSQFFNAHGSSRFESTKSGSNQKVYNRLGYAEHDFNGVVEEYLVFPNTFKTEVAKNFDSKHVARLLIEKGVLQTDKDGNPAINKRIHGQQQRLYTFKADKLAELD